MGSIYLDMEVICMYAIIYEVSINLNHVEMFEAKNYTDGTSHPSKSILLVCQVYACFRTISMTRCQ